MKLLEKKHVAVWMLALSACLFYTCQKETSGGVDRARLQVYLTDDPGAFNEVIIDIQDVKVQLSSDTAGGWQSLSQVRTGTYDLLRLVDDKDTLLGGTDLPSGRIEQIRLVLGPNNFVKVDGQTYELKTPSAQQSGLKLNVHQDIEAGLTYKLLLDFDVARSVIKTGNGKYILKPVIRTSLAAAGGSIRGFVLPDSVQTAVFAIQGADTVTGSYTSQGHYTLKGLAPGDYTVAFVPTDSTYKTQQRAGIVVTTGQTTVVDTVRLVR